MGFVSGFVRTLGMAAGCREGRAADRGRVQTGGATLTLSLAYLSVLAHQRTRDHQSRHLRAQALALEGLVDPIPQPLAPSRSEVAAARRAASVEAAKDRWNEEIEKAARWAQSTDWVEVREGLEARIAGLWASAFGESAAGAEAAADKLEPLARKTEAAARQAGANVATAARRGYQQAADEARDTAQRYESVAENRALEARLAARRQVTKAEGQAKEAAAATQGAVASALEKGRDKAQEMVDKVKTAVGLAEDKPAATADGKEGKTPSAVERALQQRYEKPETKATRTVAEVLRERYTPMDERDNTMLRGL